MQKLPEVSDGKKGWLMRKEKRQPLDKEEQVFFLFQAVTIWSTTPFSCLGTTHTSLDVALVSPFHPVAALSRSALCWNIKDPQMNYKLTLTGLWQTSKKQTNSYGSPKYRMRTNTCMKRLAYFDTLTGGFNHFNVFRKTPSSMEWLLNPVNKGKYKRNVFVSYLLLSFLLFKTK